MSVGKKKVRNYNQIFFPPQNISHLGFFSSAAGHMSGLTFIESPVFHHTEQFDGSHLKAYNNDILIVLATIGDRAIRCHPRSGPRRVTGSVDEGHKGVDATTWRRRRSRRRFSKGRAAKIWMLGTSDCNNHLSASSPAEEDSKLGEEGCLEPMLTEECFSHVPLLVNGICCKIALLSETSARIGGFSADLPVFKEDGINWRKCI